MNQLPQTVQMPKLFMLLLGSKAPKRNVEQHDYFFGIANSLKELVPQIKAFWPEAGNSIHIDGWREVNRVDDYEISVMLKSNEGAGVTTDGFTPVDKKLFFINLGGYQANKLEEQHYVILTVQDDRSQAVQSSKKTVFFKTNSIKGANSHIDEKYGIDVDDIYRIEEILDESQKELYKIVITPSSALPEDEIHLGYFKLDKL
ncbi:MAG: DUF1543 domain-containing protein [Pedobacter sp.]|nr:DUF1543 domain-containing protein [Pedobacter sp.]